MIGLQSLLLSALIVLEGPATSALAVKGSAAQRPDIVQNALERNEPIYYFGLGSNMSRKKLENRGVNGTKIDIMKMEAAIVPNYRLAFNMRGFPPIEPGMGSLEPVDADSKAVLAYEHGECHGALVKLTPENYEKVMRSEGVGGQDKKGAQQQGYEEIVVDAYPYSRPNNPVKAIALRARPHVRLAYDPCPSVRYMNILKEGAKELGLKPCYQDFLARHPVQALPTWQKKVALYNLIFTATISFKLKWRLVSRLQSTVLFWVYARPSASPLVKLVSDVLTVLILLPGAMIGCFCFHTLKLFGKTPPFLTRMMTMFDASSTLTSSTVKENEKKTKATLS